MSGRKSLAVAEPPAPPRDRETPKTRNRGEAIAAALAEFPPWMESNNAMNIRGMRKEMNVLPAR